jgi:HNH endonuclease
MTPIPYLVKDSEFYAPVKEVIARGMPLEPGKVIECNVQKSGGYKSTVEVDIKPGEEFISSREYTDPTRFSARIKAAATALRDSGNLGHYLISHYDGVITITKGRDPFAPTANQAELEQAAKELLASGTMREPDGTMPEPEGSDSPEKVETTRGAFVRDPKVIVWVLANAEGLCEACDKPGPFISVNGWPFLEVHHVKMLAEGGPDNTKNAVAVCPNCHRRFHFALDRESFVESIYERVSRLIRQ